MTRFRFYGCLVLVALIFSTCPNYASAWHDETHVAIAKAAGYEKWFNATGADMAKIKAGKIEGNNHHCNQPRGTVVTSQTVLRQVDRYNQAEYHLAFCGHYVGDLSQPLHNTLYGSFNKKHHVAVDGIVNDEILDNPDKIKIYPITITSEEELAREIARIANLSLKLGYRMEDENRLLTKEEAYTQISHSASLFKAILKFVGR
jgi:hypothetical protein